MLPLILAAAGLGLGAKALNYFNANSDQDKAQAALDELYNSPYAKYQVNPELQKLLGMAKTDVANPQGYTGAEKAAYNSNVAGDINTLKYNATSTSGGNLSAFIARALNPSAVVGANQFAANDASIARNQKNLAYGRLGSAVSAIQNIDNMNTQAELNRRMQKEQYLGNAVLQNKAFKTNTLDSIGADLLGAGTMGLYSYLGGSNPSGGYDYTGENAVRNNKNAGVYLNIK